ncbi:RtcB family protein [Bradyrhizobium sediminis]|uniref:tRNA-splicing ligase RtcB n=1 Tax=Bradyrhizobium sediminis TaxID=2840469 RepID=A0A975NWP1_9BRAD|nr:RtcB family protein [Bradyrhizobium sediminis]QWG22773.1 RtcB family protein [Bradyrhizobium sediminis]
MDPARFTRVDATTWRIEPFGAMRVPAIIYADEDLIRAMDDKVFEQVTNVAMLPGIVRASYAMPDAHWGYGFPIGGVAAFDPDRSGIVSAGGVGFDVSCGVRTMLTGLDVADILPVQKSLADSLYRQIPAGVGSTGAIVLDPVEMDAMLTGGACWATEHGWGDARDLERIEEQGRMAGARPECVSDRAKERQRLEMGTLGSGNHYLEVQAVAEIFDTGVAEAFGLRQDNVVVTIHCGSRGLGHQIGTEFLKEMVVAAEASGIALPDRELACAPIHSEIGQRYLGAMRAAINCALANREILGHYARRIFGHFFPDHDLRLLFDVSHNTCKVEPHVVDGKRRNLFVHRKGATRAFGPGHESLPQALRAVGQPVLIGGSMGTGSHILVGATTGEEKAFSSACHGAGRALSRHAALKQWSGRKVIDDLAAQGILIRSPSSRGVAEEAPGAYKDVDAVVMAAEHAGLARRVARLRPLICIKG